MFIVIIIMITIAILMIIINFPKPPSQYLLSPAYLITVEYEHLPSEQPSESLHRFGLASAGWAVWISPEPDGHALCQCQVTLVGQRRVHQFGRVALVLVCVVKLCIHHAHDTCAGAVTQVVSASEQDMPQIT